MPAPHHSHFYRPDALPAAQPTASKHWRHRIRHSIEIKARKTWLKSTEKKLYNAHLTHSPVSWPRWGGTRKVKPIWILLKQETVSGSGISWAIRKSAPSSRQITMPAPHHSLFTDQMPFQQHQSTEGNVQFTHHIPIYHLHSQFEESLCIIFDCAYS